MRIHGYTINTVDGGNTLCSPRCFSFGVPNWQKTWTHAEGAPEYHVERANADSHARRSEAIAAKRRQDSVERDKASKGGGFKAW